MAETEYIDITYITKTIAVYKCPRCGEEFESLIESDKDLQDWCTKCDVILDLAQEVQFTEDLKEIVYE